MNFIQLQDQRINLDNIIYYYPAEKIVTLLLNEKVTWYEIRFEDSGQHNYQLCLCYQNNLAARDLDLKTLDFVCVRNKRGAVQELKKVQQP